MSEMSRVDVRQALEDAAFGGPLDQALTQMAVSQAKLVLAAATIKPMPAVDALAVGQILQRYEALVEAVRWVSEARERGNMVDFWRIVAIVEELARRAL